MYTKKIIIVVHGNEEEDMDDAINEVARLLKEGYLSGANSNDSSGFSFESTGDVDTDELPE